MRPVSVSPLRALEIMACDVPDLSVSVVSDAGMLLELGATCRRWQKDPRKAKFLTEFRCHNRETADAESGHASVTLEEHIAVPLLARRLDHRTACLCLALAAVPRLLTSAQVSANRLLFARFFGFSVA